VKGGIPVVTGLKRSGPTASDVIQRLLRMAKQQGPDSRYCEPERSKAAFSVGWREGVGLIPSPNRPKRGNACNSDTAGHNPVGEDAGGKENSVPERRLTTAVDGKKQRPWRKREAAWQLPVCPHEMANIEDPKESNAHINPLRTCPQRGGRSGSQDPEAPKRCQTAPPQKPRRRLER
jgi:hypothetical protein